MKTRVAFGLLLGLALMAGLLGTPSCASAQKGALVTIPFAFEANQQMLPAGEYKVYVLTPHLISLIDHSTGTYKGLLLVRPEAENEIESQGRLIFFHHDKRYYLKQIRFAGTSLHADLMVPASLQRELAQTKPAESTIEIAMK